MLKLHQYQTSTWEAINGNSCEGMFAWVVQASVVQTVDSAVLWINTSKTNWVIQWIVIYPLDSTIQRLNKWSLSFIFCYKIIATQYLQK